MSDALEDDAFDLSLLEISSQLDASLSTSSAGIHTPDVTQLTSDDSTILTNRSMTISSPLEASTSHLIPLGKSMSAVDFEPCVTEFEAEKLDNFNENAWGKELNRTKSIPDASPNDSKAIPSNGAGSLRKTMSDKLFRNSSFVKRNPRKSLSRTSLTASQLSIGSGLGSSSQRESLPDLETILSQKSMQMKDNEINASQESIVDHSVTNNVIFAGKTTNSNLINSIDYEWLNRCNQSNNVNTDESGTASTASQSMPAQPIRQTYGLSNINANVLQTLEAASLSVQVKSNMGAGNSTATTSKAAVNGNDDDDDEEIANSEDESVNNNSIQIRTIRKSMNKRKHSDIDKPSPTAFKSNADDEVDGAVTAVKEDIEARLSVDRKVVKGKRVAKKPPVAPVAPQVPVNRRSTRTRTTKMLYAEAQPPDDSGTEIAEEDPFAFDDSDADPDFGEELKKRESNRSDDDTTTSDPSQDIDVTASKKTTKKEKKTKKVSVKVVRKRVVKQPSIKPDQVRKIRRVAVTRKKTNVEDGNAGEVVEETPDDYLMEFGIDHVKSVPRIAAVELAKNTQRFTEYVHSSEALQMTNESKMMKTTTSVAGKPLTTKNSMAKEKLEKRVAAGTVNENFVRINLRKKVFVRGKKTVNFSRYKKQQWRNKKAAALIGPEMDMRGCDGGLLMCFQCGLPGHFAQNCKVKSEFHFSAHIQHDRLSDSIPIFILKQVIDCYL